MDLTLPIVPQGGFGFEGGLLTALVIGILFGFSLEKAGFGNARKLAAQFYLYDMTVFKVMFTGIIVAMTGLYALEALGWIDLGFVWINPTWIWPQLLGGFMLGAGFIISGLCPGTAFVSLVSGKLDAILVIVGVFIGIMIFALGLDFIPALDGLYHSGKQGFVTLPELLGIPGIWLSAAIVLVALVGFIGAEKVEALMEQKLLAADSNFAPSRIKDNGAKFWMAGTLLAVCITVGLGASHLPGKFLTAPAVSLMSSMELATEIIGHNPELVTIDLRVDGSDLKIPNLLKAEIGTPPLDLLQDQELLAVLIVESDLELDLLKGWPTGPSYAVLEGGAQAWQKEILQNQDAREYSLQELNRVKVQNQVSAWFNGTESKTLVAPPPPVSKAGGKRKKKRDGGC